jgi:single-strand DNA-binding protein
MNDLNSVLIEGKLTDNPDFCLTAEGEPVCAFVIVSARYYETKTGIGKELNFFGIEAWGKPAEACSKQGREGRGARVVGRLKQGGWTDSKGDTLPGVFIIAEHVEFRPEAANGKAAETGGEPATGQGDI